MYCDYFKILKTALHCTALHCTALHCTALHCSHIFQATEIPGNASSTTIVFITIEDINNNKPTFPTTGFSYTASIPEDTPIGTPIFFQMGAFDNDREVGFSLEGLG